MCEAEFHLRKILHRREHTGAGVLVRAAQYVQFSESLAKVPAVAALRVVASWAPEGGHARSAGRSPTCTCPCMLEKPLIRFFF